MLVKGLELDLCHHFCLLEACDCILCFREARLESILNIYRVLFFFQLQARKENFQIRMHELLWETKGNNN